MHPTTAVAPAALQKTLARQVGATMAIFSQLHSRKTYTDNSTRKLSFFQEKAGSAATVTEQETNLTANGALPAGNFFQVHSVEIDLYPNLAQVSVAPGAQAANTFVNDVYLLGKSGIINFIVDGKKILPGVGPIGKFPPSSRMAVDAAIADVTTAGAALQTRIAYAQWVGPVYTITPVTLEPGQAFTFDIEWPGGAVNLEGGDAVIQVTFNGLLYRPN